MKRVKLASLPSFIYLPKAIRADLVVENFSSILLVQKVKYSAKKYRFSYSEA
jgi:hypothetical protein